MKNILPKLMKKDKQDSSTRRKLGGYPLVSGQSTLERKLLADLDLKFDDIPSEPGLFSKDVSCIRFDPMARLYSVSVETEHERQDRGLVSLLNAHSFGVPLIVAFNVQDKSQEVKKLSSVLPIFHCPRCYLMWEITGKLPFVCSEPAQLFKGPAVSLSTNDAFLLIDVLNWNKKFVTTELKNAFPLLRKETNSLEKNLILKSVARRKISRKPDPDCVQRNFYSLAVEEAIHIKNNILIPCACNSVSPTESEVSRYIDEFEGSIQVVGMKGNDGSFYPGFFSISFLSSSKSIQKTQSRISNSKSFDSYDFDFVARCKISEDGDCSSDDISDATHSNLKEQFPTLLGSATAQIRKKCTAALKSLENLSVSLSIPTLKFRFLMQDGFEADLSKIFANGLWYIDGDQQYIFPGLFDRSKRFIAAYCVTIEGYLIPGCSGEEQRFFPFAKYGPFEHKPIKIHKCNKNLNKEKIKVLENLNNLPKFPSSDDVTKTENWFCFKDKAIIGDPSQITVPFDHVHLNHENLTIYVGCEKGFDCKLYMYGQYNEKGDFVPGCSALDSEQEFHLLPNFQSVENPYKNFAERFGICFHEQSFLTKQQFNYVDNFSSDVRMTSESNKNFEISNEKLATPTSSMDDTAWLGWKQATRHEKEEALSGRSGSTKDIHRKVSDRSDSRSLERALTSEHSSLYEGSDRGSLGSKGMSWFNPHQRKLYEQLSMSEEELGSESDVERKSSMSSPPRKNRKKLKDRGILRSPTMKDSNQVLGGGAESERKTPHSGVDDTKLNPSGMPPPPLSIPNRFDNRQIALGIDKKRPGPGPAGKKLKPAPLKDGADDRGIGMIGGVGLVTKEVRREKEIPKILERHPVDTNRNKGLNRQPEPTFQSFTGKLTHEKKSVPERPLPEKVTSEPEPIKFKLPEARSRKKPPKPKRRLEKDRLAALNKEEIRNGDYDVKNISEPEEIQKKILSPDDIRERLQSLGTFKAIPDGDKIETRVIVEEKKESDNAKRLARLLFRKERKSTFESDFLPNIADFSPLNFTQSFRFSYFSMPDHVKNFNKQVQKGSIKLPAISNPKLKAKKPKSLQEENIPFNESMPLI